MFSSFFSCKVRKQSSGVGEAKNLFDPTIANRYDRFAQPTDRLTIHPPCITKKRNAKVKT
ncbi:hypothetical protein DSM3645_20537 [Blastopirellula marina DSM 3645]|uniref:Uncharacterized protein n=1 Tax=Blastopirellula marina DSM 3645 TaxID=314230 RepID=A3ZQQ9_9BACT|nr:hypothetical protein DSM3645_20537 [Blastopirellula marina DSM 3645]